MKRNTTRTVIQRTMRDTARITSRRAFLLTPYDGYVGRVLIAFTDPKTGVRGATTTAYIRSGLVSVAVPRGTPVMVRVLHGQAEVMSVG